MDSACMATKVAPLLGILADFHNILNFMPCTIVAYANYIKLAQCNQLCCNSTLVSGKLLYRHLCRNSCSFPSITKKLGERDKEPIPLTSSYRYLRPSFPLLQAPATFFSKFSNKAGKFPVDDRSSQGEDTSLL